MRTARGVLMAVPLLILGWMWAAAPVQAPQRAAVAAPHVLVIMEENKGYKATLGTCSADPYLCSLAKAYTSLVGWTGVSHPSLPNYLAVDSGSTQGCSSDGCATGLKAPDFGAQLDSAGIPWDAYMESMPKACDTASGAGAYARKHNPFVYFTDEKVCHDLPYPGEAGLVKTLDGTAPPAFVWITPNLNDDMHDGSVQAGDKWLQGNLAPILASKWFTGSPSTVIVTMDEGDPGCCNAIPMVVISSNASGKGNVSLKGNHYGTLRSIEETYGLPLLGAAGKGTDLAKYFG